MGSLGSYRIPIRRGSIREFFAGDPAMKGCWSLDGHARDESGNGNHGTVSGAIPYPANFHQGYYFNGSNNSISIGNFEWGGSTTLLAWRKAFTGASGSGIVLTKGNASTWGMRLNSDGNVFAIINGVLCYANPVCWPKVEEYAFQAATFNSVNSGLTAYINGCKGTTTFQQTGALRGGSGSLIGYLATYPFMGIIYEVAIFYRTLSSAEISQYYQWTISGPRKYWYYNPIMAGNWFLLPARNELQGIRSING